ncbi:hypothetical protein HGQ17_12615 [Nesterenkonia sp. MY13]|uniref:NADH:quinone oxidoreductase/Mrp antiporter transmembrane domain-containing protein n=2 Tax=Nesterenkonia sedimenti TaxID=1463632 RepID=A0A7X8TLD5_9MICC|nr:hypothetical protein [Nesterenkonia sedimenti]
MGTEAILLGLSLLMPLVAVAVIALAGTVNKVRAHRIRRMTAMASPLAVLPAALLTVIFDEAQLDLPWLLFGTGLMMDAPARALTLIAVLLYGAALTAISWVKARDAERGSGALSAFLLVCFTGNIGTYLAADALSFYLAFTVMSFSAAGLVIHYRTEAARRATRIYLIMSVISETAILAGFILLVTAEAGGVTGSAPTGLVTALLLIGFGVKAGTVPLHVWLPVAHPAAPPAASAVLSGAMVKAGLIGWLRFLPEAGGNTGASEAGLWDAEVVATAGGVLLALALLGAFAAVVLGVVQQDPKVVLAYSTISQMGFISALVAVGMMVPALAGLTAAAAVLYAVHHGLAKGALFLGVPVVKHYGTGFTGWLVLIGMAGAALAVAGAPLTSGAYGKYVSKTAVEEITVLGIGLDQILPLVATGSTLLLLRFGFLIWQQNRETEASARAGAQEGVAGWLTHAGPLFSWLGVCLAGILVPWLIGQYWLAQQWVPETGEISWSPSALWDALWPILLGLLVGLAAVVLRWRTEPWAQRSLLQPGDLLVAEESLAARSWRGTSWGLDAVHASSARLQSASARRASQLTDAGQQGTIRTESVLKSWEGSGLVVLVLVAIAVVVTIWGGVW